MRWLLTLIIHHRLPRFRFGVAAPRLVLWEVMA